MTSRYEEHLVWRGSDQLANPVEISPEAMEKVIKIFFEQQESQGGEQ